MRRTRGDDGATAVEVALVLPLLLSLLGGVLVFGLHMTYSALAEHAAAEGLRKAVIRTSTGYPDADQVDTTVRSLPITGVLGAPTEQVLVEGARTPPRGRQGDRVTVTVRYEVPVVAAAAALVPFSDLTGLRFITRSTSGRLE